MRLPPILSTLDFSLAELSALRLDGEAFGIDDCVIPIDEVEGQEHRALALLATCHPKMMAEQFTAGWVWGAVDSCPTQQQFCIDTTARIRGYDTMRMSVREVVLDEADTALVAGLRVTTPLRTATDIARFVSHWRPEHAAVVLCLMEVGRFTVADCVDAMNRRKNLPNKRRAIERLFAASPALLTP